MATPTLGSAAAAGAGALGAGAWAVSGSASKRVSIVIFIAFSLKEDAILHPEIHPGVNIHFDPEKEISMTGVVWIPDGSVPCQRSSHRCPNSPPPMEAGRHRPFLRTFLNSEYPLGSAVTQADDDS